MSHVSRSKNKYNKCLDSECSGTMISFVETIEIKGRLFNIEIKECSECGNQIRKERLFADRNDEEESW